MRTASAFLTQPRRQIQLLLVTIFSSLLFIVPSVAKYHSDECFYTDAAIRMSASGNYWTPYTAGGALRFAKPILPYWGVLGGYALFGINFLGSRILFLVAGCLVIYYTYRLSLVLFGHPAEAALAAMIAGSNVQLLTIAIRSTPDALLTLFVLLSLFGFARIIFAGETRWRNYAVAYLGAGLAVETRGLPGLSVAVFPFVFCLLCQRRQIKLRQLVEWKALTLGVLVAFSWFGVMLWLHGHALIDGFYYDQVTENIKEFSYLSPVKNVWGYFTGFLRHFLPWSALIGLGLLINKRVAIAFWQEHRTRCWFLLSWYLFILSPFILGETYRTRYMTVAYPLLAVLLAGLLHRYFVDEKFERWMIRVLAAAALVVGLAAVALIAAGAVTRPRIIGAGVLLLLTALVLGRVVLRKPRWAYGGAIATLALALFWTVELFLRPAFSQSPAAALTARLIPDEVLNQRVYGLNLSPSFQAQMRVLSGGRLTVVPLLAKAASDLPPGSTPLIFTETEKPLLREVTGDVEQVGFASRRWHLRDFLDYLDSAKRAEVIKRNSVPYYVLH